MLDEKDDAVTIAKMQLRQDRIFVESSSSKGQHEATTTRPSLGSHQTQQGQQQCGERAHLRPDCWVGKRTTKRSWKVKTKADVKSSALEETCSVRSVAAEVHDDSASIGIQTVDERVLLTGRPVDGTTPILPDAIRPIDNNNKQSSSFSSNKSQGGERGHLRPDGWVGKRTTKRSWKVKTKSADTRSTLRDNQSMMRSANFVDDGESIGICTFDIAEIMPEAKKNDDERREKDLPDVPDDVICRIKHKKKSSVLDDSVHSSLTEDSRFVCRAVWSSPISIDSRNDTKQYDGHDIVDVSAVSSKRQQAILPAATTQIRREQNTAEESIRSPTNTSSSTINHNQCGHNRPDVWVGKKTTKRSWRVKSKLTVGNSYPETCSVIGEQTDAEDTASIGICTFDVGMFSERDAKKNEGRGKKNDKDVPAIIHQPRKGKQSQLDSSIHSVLTEDSRSRVSCAREMWNNIGNKNATTANRCGRKNHDNMSSVGVSSAIKRLKSLGSSERTGAHPKITNSVQFRNSTAQKGTNAKMEERNVETAINKDIQDDDKYSALIDDDVIPRSVSITQSPTNSCTESLPELEMSMTSLDFSSHECSSDHDNESGRGSFNRSVRPNHVLSPRRLSSNAYGATEKRDFALQKSPPSKTQQHNIRALNRPNNWIGGSAGSKPKRSWTVKRIIE